MYVVYSLQAGTQFKTSLSELMDILMRQQPSYIRCIKPNDFKRDGVFDENIIRHQTKYLGLMENLRVRRAGFCYRRNLKYFLQRSALRHVQPECPSTLTHVCVYVAKAKSTVQSYCSLAWHLLDVV